MRTDKDSETTANEAHVSAYDAETALHPIGPGEWTTTISSRWNIGDNPNGGYLLSSVLQAMAVASDHKDPLSVTTHYLRPGTGDENAVVRVEVVRAGRSQTTMRGSLTQQGKERLEVIAVFGDLPEAATEAQPGKFDMSAVAPDLPPPEDCILRSGAEQALDLPILDRVEVRVPPEYAQAGTRTEAEIVGWIRFCDGREPDSRTLPLFTDAFPPSLFAKLGNIGWVPTIELTVHVRQRPAPGWVRGRFRSADLVGGRCIEDGMLWDSSGALVAQCRQIALIRMA